MVVLIDTNVLIDSVAKRTDFMKSAEQVFEICSEEKHKVDGYISAHSLMDLCYILRKSHTREERKEALHYLCGFLTVVETTQEAILSAIDNEDFEDFEDSVVNEAAASINADFIITRDEKKGHFKNAEVPIKPPEEFIKLFK